MDPGVRRATLFTGHLSAANLRLYERLGYVGERPMIIESPDTANA
ncbi:hypothetical protein [Actinoallomurus purpureus]|nr:hypothetical protein [Actinoallomurus purpureus]